MDEPKMFVLTLTKEEFIELYKMMRLSRKIDLTQRTVDDAKDYMSLWRKVNDLGFYFLTFPELKSLT